MKWQGVTGLVPVVCPFELLPCNVMAIHLEKAWLSACITFLDVISDFLDVVLVNRLNQLQSLKLNLSIQ